MRTSSQSRDLLESGRSFERIVAELGADGRWNAELFPHPYNDHALQGNEFERVTRQGYLKAIALALGHSPPVPIKTFWMTGVGNATFEMHITDERDHVSVTLLVPKVPGGTHEPGSPESWVVTIDVDGQVEVTSDERPGLLGAFDERRRLTSACKPLLGLLTEAPHPELARVLHDAAEDRSSRAVVAGTATGLQEPCLPVSGSGYEGAAPDALLQVQRSLEVGLGGVPSFERRAQHALVAVGSSETRQPDDRYEQPTGERLEEIVEQRRM